MEPYVRPPGGGETPPPNILQYRYPLYAGATAEVTFLGRQVTVRDLRLLRDYLALAEKTLEDDVDAAAAALGDAIRSSGARQDQQPRRRTVGEAVYGSRTAPPDSSDDSSDSDEVPPNQIVGALQNS